MIEGGPVADRQHMDVAAAAQHEPGRIAGRFGFRLAGYKRLHELGQSAADDLASLAKRVELASALDETYLADKFVDDDPLRVGSLRFEQRPVLHGYHVTSDQPDPASAQRAHDLRYRLECIPARTDPIRCDELRTRVMHIRKKLRRFPASKDQSCKALWPATPLSRLIAVIVREVEQFGAAVVSACRAAPDDYHIQ